MIEMDQFAVTLSGVESELIERKSTDSAATMKNTEKPILELEFLFKFLISNHLFLDKQMKTKFL